MEPFLEVQKKTRALDNIYSPGCNFSVEKKDTDTNNIACYVINKSSGFHNKNPTIYFGCSVIDAFTGVVKIFEHHIQKQDTVEFEYLENFEKKYSINLWQLGFNERLFYQYNDFYKFSQNEILSILEKECKLYESILDDVNLIF